MPAPPSKLRLPGVAIFPGGAILLLNGWDRADDIRNCRLRRAHFPRRGGTLNVPASITDEVARKNCHAPLAGAQEPADSSNGFTRRWNLRALRHRILRAAVQRPMGCSETADLS